MFWSITIWLAVTIILYAFLSGIETAYGNINRLAIELRKKQGHRSGILLSKLIENPSVFTAAVIAASNLVIVIYALLFYDEMSAFVWKPLHASSDYLKLLVDIFIAFVLLLLLAEFLPKPLFRARNDGFLATFSPVINLVYKIFQPLANLFTSISKNILVYLFNVRLKDDDEYFCPVDLDHFHQQTKDDDDDQQLNTELFENALSLPNVKIRQCLVPRTEIEAIEINMPVAAAVKKFVETKLSKIVVYDGNIDNITGYIHQLDMFKKPQEIKSVLLPIPVVPETMSARDLMNKFTRDRKSIALVVDEFGGTSGIVTMEDLLEEIFGEIEDEYDTEIFVEKQIAENEYIFSGRLELDYLNEKYSLDFPENESETLSGYIINAYESIPRQKERIIIDKYEFDVVTVSETRIDMVKMKVLRQ